MSFFSERQWALKEAFLSLKKDKAIFALSVLMCSLALSVPLFIGGILYDLSAPFTSLPTHVEMTLFLNNRANIDLLVTDMEALDEVDHVQVIPKAEAFETLNKKLGIKDLVKFDNPLPDILVLSLKADVSPERIESLSEELNKNKSIDMTAYENEWRNKLESLTRATLIGVSALGVVVSALVILILSTVVRLTTHSIKPLMKTLFVFGATPSFSIRPWAWRGAMLLGTSSGLALGLCCLGILLLRPSISEIAQLYQTDLVLNYPSPVFGIIFVLILSGIGALTAALSAFNVWRTVQH